MRNTEAVEPEKTKKSMEIEAAKLLSEIEEKTQYIEGQLAASNAANHTLSDELTRLQAEHEAKIIITSATTKYDNNENNLREEIQRLVKESEISETRYQEEYKRLNTEIEKIRTELERILAISNDQSMSCLPAGPGQELVPIVVKGRYGNKKDNSAKWWVGGTLKIVEYKIVKSRSSTACK